MAGNFVYLEGRLIDYKVRKLDFGKNGGEKRVANVTVACANGGKNGPAYYNIEFWNPRPEQSKRFKEVAASKDEKCRVALSGYLKMDTWEGKDGEKRKAVKIVATSLNEAFDPPEREEGNDRGNDRGGFRGKSGGGFQKGGSFNKNRKPSRNEDEEESQDEDENEAEDQDDEEEQEERKPAKSSKPFKKPSKRTDDDEEEGSSDDGEDAPF